MDPRQNPYACLGLVPGSSAADIKRKYRQLAKKYHPDTPGNAASEDKLRVLNAAYEFLSDPAKKLAYDSAFAARNSVFSPTRIPQPARSPRRRGPSVPALFGLLLLFALSAGAGLLFSQQNTSLTLAGLYSRLSGKSAGPDRPPPSYTFLPSHGAFDDSSNASSAPDADVPAQASLP